MSYLIKGGADQTVCLQVYNEDGTEKTDLAYNTAGLKCYYKRGAVGAATAITLATQTNTGAHADGGFVPVDATNMPGLYRLDLPDAVATAGVGKVWITLSGVAGVSVVTRELDLLSDDPTAAAATTAEIADATHDEAVDGAITMRQLLRGIASALLAKASGLGTTTATFRDLADTKDRITATVDADGNRTAVTRDLT